MENMEGTDNLFAYGTLMFPDIMQKAAGYNQKESLFSACLNRIKRIFLIPFKIGHKFLCHSERSRGISSSLYHCKPNNVILNSFQHPGGTCSGAVYTGAILKGYTRRQVKRENYPAIFPTSSLREERGNPYSPRHSREGIYPDKNRGGNPEGWRGGVILSEVEESRPDMSLLEVPDLSEGTAYSNISGNCEPDAIGEQSQGGCVILSAVEESRTPYVENTVEGLLYKNIPPEAWPRLDEFEGDMYYRQTVRIELPDGTILPAQTYVLRPEFMHLLEDFDWDYDNFLHQHITRFQRVYGSIEKKQ